MREDKPSGMSSISTKLVISINIQYVHQEGIKECSVMPLRPSTITALEIFTLNCITVISKAKAINFL